MAEVLREANLNISSVFPWNEFIASIEDLRTMCIIHGVLNMPIMLLDSGATSKYFCQETDLLESVLFIDRTPLVCEQMETVPLYRARLLEALLELYDRVAG